MKIIKQREYVDGVVEYTRFFEYEKTPGAGYCFPSDNHGNVNVDKLLPAGRLTYQRCMNGSIRSKDGERVIDRGMREFHHRGYWEPAVGHCDCGCEVELGRFTNTCDRCGADYNMSGQRLADRSQWGEETGESVSDILAADSDSDDWYLGKKS